MYLNAKNVGLSLSAASQSTRYATVANPILKGTDANELLGGTTNSVLSGGKGDDYYVLWDITGKAIEKANEGNDTVEVKFAGGYILPDNIENLVLNSPWAWWGTGNAQDNILIAGNIGATLDGGGGNDVLVGGAGADVFKVTAGKGSDAIYNFQSGWDSVQLQGYGIASFADLKAAATQVGDDVQIGFANGEKLVLRGVQLNNLTGADFGFSSIGGTVNASKMALGDTTTKIMNGATNAWNTNGVYLLNLAWNPGSLKYGTDYQIESVFNQADTSKNATFNWAFPVSTDPNFSIKAYPSIMFGVSPYGDTKNVADTAHTFPVKLADLVSMTANFDVAIAGNKGGFNVAYDIWFTNTPNGGPSTVTNEIMIWTHKGTFDAFGTLLGDFNAGGVKGKVYNSGTYTAIVADTDMMAGSIDMAAVFKALTKMGILSTSNYLASVQLGSEVNSGVGTLKVNNFSLSVETSDQKGGTILKEASGAGTTVTYKPAPTTEAKLAPVVEVPSAVSKLIAAGAQKMLDAAGVATGVQQINKLTANATETLRYDLSGTLIGREVVEKNGLTTISRYDAKGGMIGADQVFVNAASTVTKHYGQWWSYQGYDLTTKNAAGATVVQHYDAKNTLVSTDATRILNGTTVKEWWDQKTGAAGVVSTTLDGNGNGKIEYLDGKWKLVNYDEYSNASGVATIKHFDATKTLTGGEVSFVDAGGVKVQENHDKAWVVTDRLFTGTAGADTIVLKDGTNAVHGGAGADVIWAGKGADAFYFETPITSDVDTIHDFSTTDDSIYLDSAIFGKLATSGGALAATAFAVDAARDASTRIIYDSKTGNLLYDADGTGSKAAVVFAHLDPGLALNAGHFHLI